MSFGGASSTPDLGFTRVPVADRKTLSEATPPADLHCSDSLQRHAVASSDGSPTAHEQSESEKGTVKSCIEAVLQ